jgi:hypothetical protein
MAESGKDKSGKNKKKEKKEKKDKKEKKNKKDKKETKFPIKDGRIFENELLYCEGREKHYLEGLFIYLVYVLE